MSAKYFCDVCGDEMTQREREHRRVRRKKGDLEVEIITAYKNVWNKGHICHKCVLDAVVKGKPANERRGISTATTQTRKDE